MLKTKTLLILTILTMLFAGLFTLALADYREDFSKTLPLKAGDVFALNNVNGDVEATGVFGSAEIETTNGSITTDGVKGSLDVETTNGGIKVSRQEGRLRAETTNGGIRLERLTFKEGIKAETTNGSITLAIEAPDQIDATLRAETTNGHISVDFPVTLQNLRQSRHLIEATIGKGGPEISLETTNGSITITK